MLISSRLPMGVATMYKPGSIIILFILFIFLNSCAHQQIILHLENIKPVLENIEPVLEYIEPVEEINNKKIIVTVIDNKIEGKSRIKPNQNFIQAHPLY